MGADSALPLLVFGPPGAGVPLVRAALLETGIPAIGWEGGQDAGWEGPTGRPGPGPRQLLVGLEASDLACLGRASSEWSDQSLPTELSRAVRALQQSRERLLPARVRADLLLDSSQLSAQMLQARILQLGACLQPQPADQPAVVVESFAYPRGVPLDLSWAIDARVLRNPFWQPELRMLSGLDAKVQEFVLTQPLAEGLLRTVEGTVQALLPELRARGRRILRIAIGCTGGFHRSVAITEELGRRLRSARLPTVVWHRDLVERA